MCNFANRFYSYNILINQKQSIMIKKGLLTLSLAVCALGMQAQTVVFSEGFDAEQTKESSAPAWYEYINMQAGDSWSIASEGQYAGAGCLKIENTVDFPCADQSWQRAIKFRNLPLQEGKSYRLTFAFKGDNTWDNGGTATKGKMRVNLMQGGENADIAILDAKGKEFGYDISYFNPTSYEKYTKMFYFASKELQDATYNEKQAGKENFAPDSYFATFNVYNPGTYYLDEITLDESYLAGIAFGGDVIRVDFGYPTNIAALAAAGTEVSGRAFLPNDCATVLVNGENAAVELVELHTDGYLYIFLAEAYTEGGETLTVSFTNPENQIQYTGDLSPEGAVPGFTSEVTTEYIESLAEVTSFNYSEAEYVTSVPLDGSFALDENITEISVTFDKAVYTCENDINYGPKAVLKGGASDEVLTVKPGQDETTKTIVFVRPSTEPLTKGSYSVTVSDIVTFKGVETYKTFDIAFETGKPVLSKTTYTAIEGVNGTFGPTEGNYPEGWIFRSYVSGSTELKETREHTEGGGFGGSRGFSFTNSTVEGGIYMRNLGWAVEGEGEPTITYGEKEGYEINLPAGDVEIRTITTGWENGNGIFRVTLYEGALDGPVAVTQDISVNGGNNQKANREFQKDAIRFNAKGGKYVMKVELGQANTALIFGGFEAYTYVETAGDKSTAEVVVDGTFKSCGGNTIPAGGSGWRIHRNGKIRVPGALVSWGGDCTETETGGGGPRVFDLSYKGIGGKGIYLDSDAHYLTYGEFLTYTDAEGAEQPEKVCALEARKYQITYYSALWKAEGIKLTLDILKQEDGVDGTPIFTRVDVIDTKSPGGNAGDASVEAMKTDFYWTCPEAGNYILRFHANGEAFVGNMTLSTCASMAIQYMTKLNEALEPAKEELEVANSSEDYRGATRDALAKAIDDYTDPDFHTDAEYNAAIANLNALVKAMSTRRANIAKFPECIASIQEGLEAAKGSKFEGLEQFPIVEQSYNDYNGVDPVTLSDEELAKAVATMGDMGTLLTNMVNDCVGFLTQQIVDLATNIVALDNEAEGDNYVLAATQAISDDQELVVNLKKLYASKLYAVLATDNPFSIFDEEYQTYDVDSIAMPFMIQNRGFYTTAQKQSSGAIADVNSFPGWNITITQNSILADWGWGGPYNCTPVRPISDAAVCTAWGTSEIDVNQNVTYMPVGIYTASIKVGDGTPTDQENLSYAYCWNNADGSEVVKTIIANDGGARNAQPVYFLNVEPQVDGNFASLTIGAGLMSRSDFSKCDDADLYMTGKLPGFDYAKAAEELGAEVATAINNVAVPAGEPVNVKFFGLDGKQVANPNGVAIKVATYKNGAVVVSKFRK